MKYVLVAALLIIILLGVLTCPKRLPVLPDMGYPIVRVVDGDTFICRIDDQDQRVRLIGVDTPESVHPNKDVEYFALEASTYLKTMLDGQSVFLQYDQANSATQHKDRYDRILAYAYRSSDSLFVNAEIIRQGYGHAYTSYPFQYLEGFLKYERDARVQKRGLWADIEDVPPVKADSVLVYFSGGSKKFHRENCRYTTHESVTIPRAEAIRKGMQPCKICNP